MLNSGFIHLLLDIIYPENVYCACCGDCIDASRIHGICDSCIEKIQWTDENPLEDFMDGFYFDDVLSCCVYGYYPRLLVYGLKVHGKRYIAKGLGKLLAERAQMDGQLFDLLVPVPVTKKKLRQRGFNQSELLAKYAAEDLKIPCETDVLFKIRETASLKLSSGNDRRLMLEGAFEIRNADKVRGKSILLVDDVITTGSTATECARMLKEAGALSVCVLCFAGSPQSVTND